MYYLRLSSKQLFHNGEHSSSARFSTNEAISISRRFLQGLQLSYPHTYPRVRQGPLALGMQEYTEVSQNLQFPLLNEHAHFTNTSFAWELSVL